MAGAGRRASMIVSATLALTAFGLWAVHLVARRVAPAAAWWTVVALVFATSLWPTLLDGTRIGLVAAAAFALASTAVLMCSNGRGALRVGAGGLWFCALAIPHVAVGHVPHPTPSALGEALFSSSEGLLFWSPILWLGIFGWAGLTAESKARASWAGGALALTTLAAAGPGPRGSMAGGFFHAALPILAVGLARSLAWLRGVVERRPAVPVVTIAASLTLWNFLFMEQYRTDRIPRDLPVSFAGVAETNASLFVRALGSPNAWPANWLFAWRHRTTPAKYDTVVGQGPWPEGFIAIDDPRIDPAALAEGWGGRVRCGGAPCRRIAGAARMLVSWAPGSGVPRAVRASGSGVVSIEINGGQPRLHSLRAETTDLPLQESADWREGVNEITFRTSSPEAAAVAGLAFGPARER